MWREGDLNGLLSSMIPVWRIQVGTVGRAGKGIGVAMMAAIRPVRATRLLVDALKRTTIIVFGFEIDHGLSGLREILDMIGIP